MAMKKKPAISVIIPTYNRRDFIADAIGSVVRQGVRNMEIVIVDDGSTDDTRTALLPYRKDIRYLHQEHHGVGAARNFGVRESRGELITFLDSDDLWIPGTLGGRLHEFPGDQGTLSCGPVEWFVDNEGNRPLLERTVDVPWPRTGEDGFLSDPALDIAEGCYLHLGTLLILKSDFLKVGFFDESLCLGEDTDWFSRAAMSMRFLYTPVPCLRLRLHQRQTDLEGEECVRSLIRMYANIRRRTAGVHRMASQSANRRLAAKWSQLANSLSAQGRSKEAFKAAVNAYTLEPLRLKRLLKAGMMFPLALANFPLRRQTA